MVGGGVVGLATAWRLQSTGLQVTVFDPAVGRGASYAAAGMLAPSAEVVVGEETNYKLQRDSTTRWRALSRELESFGAPAIGVHQVGTLLVGWDASDRRSVAQHATVLRSFGAEYREIQRSELPHFFDGVSDRISQGIFMEDDGWLDPDEALFALRTGLTLRGVEWVASRVETITPVGGHVRLGVGGCKRRFDAVLVATGAESLVEGIESRESVRSVRGSTIRGRGFDRFGLPMLRAFVRGRPFYLVGRREGEVLFGASAEEKDALSVEIGELHRLLRDALDVMPTLETLEWQEIRTGRRPASPSGEPFFDAHPDERWAWMSGHYRHGVTLAPLATEDALAFVQGVLQ